MSLRKIRLLICSGLLVAALCLAGSRAPRTASAATAAPTTVTASISAFDDDEYQDGTTVTNDAKTVWLGDNNSTTASYAALRFAGVSVPRGSSVQSASLRLYSIASDATRLSVNVYGDASGNSAKFTATSLPSDRSATVAKTDYSNPAAWSANTWYSVDVTTIVQEITARADWNSGNALSVILKGNSGAQGARRGIKGCASWDSTNVAQLVVSYAPVATPLPTATPTTAPTNTVAPTAAPTNTVAPTAAPTNTVAPTAAPSNTVVPTATPTNTVAPTAAPTKTPTSLPPSSTPTRTAVPNTPVATATASQASTVNAAIAAYDDDEYQDGTTATADSKTVWIGDNANTAASYAGLRFAGVSVPRGSAIQSASLRLYSVAADATSLKVNVYGDASGNSAKFTASSLPSGRALTAAYTTYANPAAWAANTWYTVDVTALIREITARTDWTSGNALSLIIKGVSGSQGARRAVKGAASWDASNVAQLVINYGGGSTAPAPTATALPPATSVPTLPTATAVPPTAPPAPTAVPPTAAPTSAPVQPNMVSNPGFESGTTGWDIVNNGGSVTTITSGMHSGSRALQMSTSSATNIAVSSNMFRVDPGQVVDASAWFKWSSVSGGSGLRMNLYAFDGSQTRIRSWDLASVDGTASSWRKMSAFVLAPAGTVYMQFRVQFTNASGTAQLDDVYVRVAQKVPAVDNSVSGPVIMPHPWQMRSTGTKLAIGSTAIVAATGETRLRNAADVAWDSTGAAHALLASGDASAANYATLMRFGDRNTADIAAAFSAKFPNNTWDQLGTQGYFLTVQKPGGQLQILAGANSEQGRFYALQSIKQIIKSGQIYTLDVLDVPTVPVRGIVMSSSRFGSYAANLQKFAGYKMNFSWNQGQFMSNKFNYDWRTALTSAEQSELRSYITEAANNFVTPWISIGPRASAQGSGSTCYSCDSDINAVVNKFNVLYGLGLRNFGLNFDDLWNVGQDSLYFQQDKTQFSNDIAKAHLYFITEVYNRFKAQHADISMMVVPLQCYLAGTFGQSQDHYLQVLSGLPAGVGLYTVQYYNEDYTRQLQLSGRATVNWSNFYAEGWVPQGTYVVPHYNFFDPANSGVRSGMTGLTYLPVQPSDEDAGQISVTTTADYFWAPDRYNPDQSFQWGAAKYLGK